jgi:anti-anti-sigma regulatory factor
VDDALAFLKDEIKSVTGRTNKSAWFALFDMLALTRNRAEYDALSTLFTVRFETSPPAWPDDAAGERRSASTRERSDIFVLRAGREGLAREIAKIGPFATAAGSLRLDLTKVTEIEGADAAEIAQTMRRLRKIGMPIWLTGCDSFCALLRQTIAGAERESQRPYWATLFETLILAGLAKEFDELGLEFAMAFEESPPNWEVYVNKVSKEKEKIELEKELASTTGKQPSEVFVLKGVVDHESNSAFAELQAYAQKRSDVVVDMSKVARFDFMYMWTVSHFFRALHAAGKKVIFTKVNEIHAALFDSFGLNRYAAIMRRY